MGLFFADLAGISPPQFNPRSGKTEEWDSSA